MLIAMTVASAPSAPWSWLPWVGFVAAVLVAIWYARNNQSRKDLVDTVTALTGRLDAKEDRAREQDRIIDAQDVKIESYKQQVGDLRASVRTLEKTVNSSDLIRHQTKVMTAGFVALGVAPEKLVVSNGSGS